jgi:hypothetical protein
MEPTKEPIDELYRERILRARATPLEDKFLAGAELFENACDRMRPGIRLQYPDVTDADVERLLNERPAIVDRLERAL